MAVQKIEQLHECGGGSHRSLYIRCGLVRSTAQRWQMRIRCGLLAIRRRGRPDASQSDSQALQEDITALRYGPQRCNGIGGLYGKWAGIFSQSEIYEKAQAERRRLCRVMRDGWQRQRWVAPGAVWAMDPGQINGMLWNLVTDMSSRFRFDIQLASHLPAEVIRQQLQALFERFGAPLVLKRDNGSNLDNPLIDELLAFSGVIGLTSPPYYPRYNGAVEYAQRELKIVAQAMHNILQIPLHDALILSPGMLNTQPRPCLAGATAYAALHAVLPTLHQTYTMDHRKEIKRWIDARTEAIVKSMANDARHVHDAPAVAKRLATETWMRDAGLVIPVPRPTSVLPH